MRKITIGYIFDSARQGPDEKAFFNVAKEMNIDLILFNLAEELIEEEIESKAKKCQIIFNNVGEDLANELIKTLEEFGKKVVDSSKAAYYLEDKWLFFVICKKKKIPTPETVLLPSELNSTKKELEDFGHWPVILKRIYGCRGEFVDRANNVNSAIRIIRKFWKKGIDRLPIIAQEYINSESYRVTVIDGKVVQTAQKPRSGWKASGVYGCNFKKFEIDKELKKIIDKTIKAFNIRVCGIDFLKKDGKWVVLEVNAEPGLDFFEKERKRLVGEIFEFLIKQSKK